MDLQSAFRMYTDFGPDRGILEGYILTHTDFSPFCRESRDFYIGSKNLPKGSADELAWLDACREFEEEILVSRTDMRKSPNPKLLPNARSPVFEIGDALIWARRSIRANDKMFERHPTHPILDWLKHPEAEGKWFDFSDGLLASMYRVLSQNAMREILKQETDPINFDEKPSKAEQESDALLYMLFRIYAAEHTRTGSDAWKIAWVEVGDRTNHGALYTVPRKDWQDYFKNVIDASHM